MEQGLTYSGKRTRDPYIHHPPSATLIPDIQNNTTPNHHMQHRLMGYNCATTAGKGGQGTPVPLEKNTPKKLYKLIKLFYILKKV